MKYKLISMEYHYCIDMGYEDFEFEEIEDFEKRFNAEINKEIEEGWEPIGGITVVGNGDDRLYNQSLIKKDKQ